LIKRNKKFHYLKKKLKKIHQCLRSAARAVLPSSTRGLLLLFFRCFFWRFNLMEWKGGAIVRCEESGKWEVRIE
jgi:hypothetical protein